MRKVNSFPDLARLPPEVAVQVLSHLDATDLCLAGCVNELWCSLANVEVLWKRLATKIRQYCVALLTYIAIGCALRRGEKSPPTTMATL